MAGNDFITPAVPRNHWRNTWQRNPRHAKHRQPSLLRL